jgi:hypothetical protein
VPDREAESAAEDSERKSDFALEGFVGDSFEQAPEKDHREVGKADASCVHGDGDSDDFGDPSQNQEIEVEGKAGLGVGRETVFEQKASFDCLAHPTGVDHVVIEVVLDSQVQTCRFESEP